MSASKSKPWNYFTRTAPDAAQCTICNRILTCRDGCTQILENHLVTVHKIHVNSIHNLQMANTKDEAQLSNNKETELVEMLARYAASKGYSIRTMMNSPYLKEYFLLRGLEMPESHSTIQKMIIDYSNTRKEKLKNILVALKAEDVKFCLTLDEWTNVNNKRFINVVLNYRNNENDTYVGHNLGLIYVKRRPDPAVFKQLIAMKLNEFNLDVDSDIVALSHNGTDKIRKYGRIVGMEQQVCFIQAMHSSIIKKLYKRILNYRITIDELDDDEKCRDNGTDESESEYDDVTISDLHLITKTGGICRTLNNIKNVFMFFKNSTVNKSILQNHLNSQDGDELNLLLDCKHKWNSLLPMLNQFVEIYQNIKQALIEIGKEYLLADIDVAYVQRLIGTLTPLVLGITELSKPSANLLTSEGVLYFVLEQLLNIDTELGHAIYDDLYEEIRRRRNSELMTLLLYLHKASLPKSCFPSVKYYEDRSAAIKYADDLIQRLFPDVYDKFTPHQLPKRLKLEPTEEGNLLYDEMKVHIETIMSDSEQSVVNVETWQSFVEKQFNILDVTRQRTPILERLYKCLLTIRPTVMTSEQAFTVTCDFNTKIRSSLKPDTLDALIFLKYQFLENVETPEKKYSIPVAESSGMT